MKHIPDVPEKSPFQQRLFRAMQILRDTLGREFEQREFAAWIGEAMGRDPFSQGWVTQLLDRADPPPVPVCLGIAKVCGVDPGWLTYGDESAAPILLPANDSKPAPRGTQSPTKRRVSRPGETDEGVA